jgi:two-component system, NarL family, nitrate/nitrite response regulator NarL
MLSTTELSTTERAFVEPLTPREQQIAAAIARGLSNKEIASEFGISTETVKRHLASIYGKLALPGRVALAIHVVRSHAA